MPVINVITKSYNVANRDLLKPITNIAGYKQYVSQKLTISILASETAITEEILQSL